MKDEQIQFEKIQSLVKGSGNWKEKITYRQENREWLKRSRDIALLILRELRRRKLTQKDFAESIGVSAQQVSKWVKGSENFTLETIAKLEVALDLQLISVEPLTAISEVETTGQASPKPIKLKQDRARTEV